MRTFSRLCSSNRLNMCTHTNLSFSCPSLYLSPSFSLLGRFDETVIEERRKAAEAMLLFSTNIPALYNSPQLKEFFRVRHTRAHTYAVMHMYLPIYLHTHTYLKIVITPLFMYCMYINNMYCMYMCVCISAYCE